MRLRITNNGENTVNVRVVDRLYNENDEEEILNEFDDSANIPRHERCQFSYYLNFSDVGDYYPKILIYAGGRLQLSFVEGLERVKSAEEAGCCVAEGYAPDDNELCCISGERRPLDYRNVGSGRCGCPTNFRLASL